jgi:hypothetical protein
MLFESRPAAGIKDLVTKDSSAASVKMIPATS